MELYSYLQIIEFSTQLVWCKERLEAAQGLLSTTDMVVHRHTTY